MFSTIKDVVDVTKELVELWQKRGEGEEQRVAMLRLLYLEALQNLDTLGMFAIGAPGAPSADDSVWPRVARLLDTAAHETALLSLEPGALAGAQKDATGLLGFFTGRRGTVKEEDDGMDFEVTVDVPAGVRKRQTSFVSVLDSLRFVCLKTRSLCRMADADESCESARARCRFTVRLMNIARHEEHLRRALEAHPAIAGLKLEERPPERKPRRAKAG